MKGRKKYSKPKWVVVSPSGSSITRNTDMDAALWIQKYPEYRVFAIGEEYKTELFSYIIRKEDA